MLVSIFKKMEKTSLTQILNIDHPIIMAPMFLISNVAMVKEAASAGITGCIPALNFRSIEEFRNALKELDALKISYGINLIVNQSNFKLEDQLKACIDFRVPFIITSLGNPRQVIEQAQKVGTKVFCVVSEMGFAEKAASYHPDALIAVTSEAGGHCGNISPEVFIPQLVKAFPNIPIISAGGVTKKVHIDKMISLGACGVSVGTVFIASNESPVSQEYKNACVTYGAKDIVLTTKLSGTPCTVINTDYVKSIGTKENFLERVLNRNKKLKKWVKMIIYARGIKKLQKAAFSATYQNVWCAGKTIEDVKEILPVRKIVEKLIS